MPSEQASRAIAELRAKREEPARTLAESRAQWIEEAAAEPLPEGTEIVPDMIRGIDCEVVTNGAAENGGTFLLLHGGGYQAGNCITHRKLSAFLSRHTGMKVVVPDYRLAPENPFPAGLKDALAVYSGLLDRGVRADRIALGGDSAGGGLAAALMLAARDMDTELPACAVLMSPWTDILARGGSYEANKTRDPSMDADRLREAGRNYTGDADPENPLISPVGGELGGLPPMLIHVGELEIMCDDATVFADRAAETGVDVTLEVWPEMWHVWHQRVPEVPEAVQALETIGGFVRARMAGPNAEAGDQPAA